MANGCDLYGRTQQHIAAYLGRYVVAVNVDCAEARDHRDAAPPQLVLSKGAKAGKSDHPVEGLRGR